MLFTIYLVGNLMLDDLKYIHNKDAQDALGIAGKQAGQYTHTFGFTWKPPHEIHEVIVAGMGGSGLGAKAYRTVPGLDVPFEVIQSYDLPERVHKNMLLICSSYSGNTEETISVLKAALDEDSLLPRPMIIVIAAGGQLLNMAHQHGLPFVQIPGGFQPRHTFGYQYRALAEIMEQSPLVDSFLPLLEKAAATLSENIPFWRPDVPTKDNYAKQLALELMGKSPVIYAGPLLFPAAYKWKISFNENAKNVAWCNQYPEFNHNEFIGWTSHPVDKPYAVIELRSSFEHERIQKRFAVSESLLSGKRPAPIIVEAQGDTILQHLLWTVALGDFVSLYLALLNGLNPTPVDLIEKFKESLKN
jgi:glucose/mannose-6-phosphate isomerase